MPRYIYSKVLDLEGTAKVGSGECAALVQHYAGAPLAASWRAGPAIRGAHNVAVGTALATFVNGRYPNQRHGNHAALYISQDATGVLVMDQWASKQSVSSRVIRFKGKNKDGSYKDPSNNADALSIIE